MRPVIILAIFFIQGWPYKLGQTPANDFTVKISYIGLPEPVTTKYQVDNKSLIALRTLYSSRTDSQEVISKYVQRKYDSDKIVSFIRRTKWHEIPTKLVKPMIDGFQYDVEIIFGGETFNYHIDNKFHPTFDTLFDICNRSITVKKKRLLYQLPYSPD